MKKAERVRGFDEFVAARRPHLRRVAYAVCHDWHRADDLVQMALEKAFLAWPRLQRAGAEEAYVRRILVRTNIDEARRAWRRERPTDEVPEPAADDQAPEPVDVRLLDALRDLPEMQRKVVVLRYWLDLSVAECAAELGVSQGTVKSHASRGLASLRQSLGDRIEA